MSSLKSVILESQVVIYTCIFMDTNLCTIFFCGKSIFKSKGDNFVSSQLAKALYVGRLEDDPFNFVCFSES